MLILWILSKHDAKIELHSRGSDQRQVAGSCEQNIELQSSLKGGEFLKQLNDY
jgi:hypothetical protein